MACINRYAQRISKCRLQSDWIRRWQIDRLRDPNRSAAWCIVDVRRIHCVQEPHSVSCRPASIWWWNSRLCSQKRTSVSPYIKHKRVLRLTRNLGRSYCVFFHPHKTRKNVILITNLPGSMALPLISIRRRNRNVYSYKACQMSSFKRLQPSWCGQAILNWKASRRCTMTSV